jgi:hypothetical protein
VCGECRELTKIGRLHAACLGMRLIYHR